MTKRMLIDAAHAEETRVVVVDGSRIEELDFETSSHKQLRGNIYLAKVTRVEPSLQAAFIEYGGNRHGFLAFNEIHPDYYQIPVADREALMREVDSEHDDEDDEDEEQEADDEAEAAFQRRQRRLMRRYKIQDVIRRRQIMLVQVVKEERGNKGAALTSYLSLAGRYGVLMPNTARGGGISRKIVASTDRRRLKTIVQGLDVPTGMGLIVRTAGAKRTKAEIRRDYDYLLRLWENIRETTLKSVAPSLIYEEEDLVKRAIRDMFDKDIDGVVVEGEAGYREARQFMRMIMPGQSAKITAYREKTPLFVAHKIEDQLAQIHSPVVPLRSGGYLVINQTEALVAIDVNSGKATRERNVEATAFKTNLEAAEEATRQLRLRDLAGLIVIDFIDMEESKNNRAVEKVLKDGLARDRARVQMGRISGFGLMEISRQRRRTGVLEGSTHICEHCQGAGRVRSVESSALAALRAVELEAVRGGGGAVCVRLPTEVALYVLNAKRNYLAKLEQVHLLEVDVVTDPTLGRSDVEIERIETMDLGDPGAAARFAARRPLLALVAREEVEDEVFEDFEPEDEDDDDEPPVSDDEADIEVVSGDDDAEEADPGRHGRRGRRPRGRHRGGRDVEDDAPAPVEGAPAAEDNEADADGEGEDEHGHRRRRRGRRGGRRLREDGRVGASDPYVWRHSHPSARPHPSEDPYGWRDPFAEGAPEAVRDFARRAERVAGEPDVQPTRDLAEGGAVADAAIPAEATPGFEGDGEGRQRDGRGRSRRGRSRTRGRGRDRGERDDAVLEDATTADGPRDMTSDEGVETPDTPAAFPAPTFAAAPEVETPEVETSEIETPVEPVADAETVTDAPEAAEPAPIALAPEPAPEPEPPAPPPAPAEPDPNEISGAPAAPRRGWWRRPA
jgi:ribonuclease E